MANILDYLDWRGDLTIQQAEFNVVDSLILCQLAYGEFDGIVPWGFDEKTITLKEAVSQYFESSDYEERAGNMGPLISEKTIEMLKHLMTCKRFANMQLCGYVNHIDEEEEKQFAAITILLGDHSFYIAYRGTDATLVGWKEDFNMICRFPIPSQMEAISYMEKAVKFLPGNFRMGGHSKGGNLAIYAAIFSNGQARERLLGVYNNDGPGLSANIVAGEDFKGVQERIITIIPQSSIIGMLLDHQEKYRVIHSTQTGIFQHDPFSWQVMGDDFVHDEEITQGSQFVDRTLSEWIAVMSHRQKEQFVDGLFDVLSATGAKTLSELSTFRFNKAKIFLETWKNVDEDTKKTINHTLKLLFHSVRKSVQQADRQKKREVNTT